MIAVLLFAFGFIAQRVAGGGSSAFDSRILLALRTSANATAVIGPAWLREAARDITSLGSVVVLMVTTLAVAGYLFLSGRHGVAWLMLIAVLGGLMLNNLLKFAFARPRPLLGRSWRAGVHHELPQRPCHTIRHHLSHDRSSARASLPVIPGEPLLHVARNFSHGARRCKSRLPWCSLSDGCDWRLVHWRSLGHRLLGADGLASARRSD